MYDYLIVTHIPAFYKINLYNQLAKELNIFVIFIAKDTDEKRSDDFTTINKVSFKYMILFNGNFQERDQFKSIQKLKLQIKSMRFQRLLISGWDLVEFWYLIFTNKKRKNCLALESTILESNTKGIKGYIKKIFLKRISLVFASGNLHIQLLEKLHFSGKMKTTQGVGIINKPKFNKNIDDRVYDKKFIFIGRLSKGKPKNLEILIKIFNTLPDYTLTIIGIGEDEEYLKKISNKNINFIGAVENSKINNYLLSNNILILPSTSEPWGLVVEEALYFGIPVIISQNCGSVELIQNNVNGFIINPYNYENIKNIILSINYDNYKKLVNEVSMFSINKKDLKQVNSYLV